MNSSEKTLETDFDHIVDHTLVAQLRDQQDNARAYKRRTVQIPCTVWLESRECCDNKTAGRLYVRYPACITNLSLNGLFFTAEQSFGVGSMLSLQVRLKKRQFTFQCIVQRCAPEELEANGYGCAVQVIQTSKTNAALPAIAAYLLANKSVSD